MILVSLAPIVICGIIGLFIFYIGPRLSKFRKTLGIDKQLASGELSFWQKLKLKTLGLKTPFLTALGTIFSFMVAESDQLAGYGFDRFAGKETAALLSAVFWLLSLWSHFSGLQHAADMPPAIPPRLPPSPK